MTTATITPQSDPVGGKLITVVQSAKDRTPQVNVSAAADDIYSIEVQNPTADPVFLKIFDMAGGPITPGTTLPDWVFRVGASTTMTYACTDALVIANGVSVFISLDGGTGVAELEGPASAITAYLLTV